MSDKKLDLEKVKAIHAKLTDCAKAMQAANDEKTMDQIEARTNELMRELSRVYGLPEGEIDQIKRDSEETVQQQVDAEIERVARAYRGEREH
jgi:tRNA U34 5-carboxymethylaminomethyl modifying GTPase MnmE/TrmE